MGNALKFTFTGCIRVEISYEIDTKTLLCAVKDTGIGIKEADIDKLFKFFGCLATSKDINKGGMGLGLTISKMIIQSLGGDITVESEPTVGSTFIFTLPIAEFELAPVGGNIITINNNDESPIMKLRVIN